MLLGVDDMAMLSEDQVSLLRQLEEDKSLLFDFEMFQGSAVTSEPDMNIITGPNRSLLAQPMTPPGGNISEPDGMMSPGSDLQALENYYPASQPSPASTVVSEQEMIEAYELVMEEVLTTIIRRLGISADPYQWTCEHVQAWISLLHQEYGRPEVNLLQFQVDGYTLCRMSQEDLEQRAPKSGYLLHSNLNCLLKMNQMEDIKPIISQCQQQQHQQHQQHHHQQQQQQQQQYQAQTMAPHPMGYDANIMYQFSMPPMGPSSPAMLSEKDLGPSSVGSSASSDEDEQSMTSPVPSPSGPNTSMTPHHTGAIQLWQFLQELLLQPDSYNYCIRFLDRTQGIFKIEDSVEVARLWGMRKNRPAMNYDKLSRSIRQYYKKGIMKKTEISQRLVYQFVKPF